MEPNQTPSRTFSPAPSGPFTAPLRITLSGPVPLPKEPGADIPAELPKLPAEPEKFPPEPPRLPTEPKRLPPEPHKQDTPAVVEKMPSFTSVPKPITVAAPLGVSRHSGRRVAVVLGVILFLALLAVTGLYFWGARLAAQDEMVSEAAPAQETTLEDESASASEEITTEENSGEADESAEVNFEEVQ